MGGKVGGLIALVGVLLVSCANPVPPSGGPRDRRPPSVVRTHPARDTVNVSTSTERLRIEFSEYIERTSLPQALSVTPTFEQQPQFSWSGRTVEISFPSSLRDSTTYIFSFSTDLTDAHGVSLENPLTVAFSTGPRINQGQIQGRVVNKGTGAPQQRVNVYAYALSPSALGPPRPFPDRPSYRTQTGEEGRFGFDYMREGRYYVIALRDNNRNRRPDAGEAFAVPPRFALRADSAAGPVPVPWLLARPDTSGPRLQGVRPVSRQRVRLSFSEPVRLQTRKPEVWAPRDSVRGTRVDVQGVYRAPNRAAAVVVRTAPMRAGRYLLPLPRGAVADTLGQPLLPDTARFRAATQADTIRTQFRGFVPSGLRRDSTGARPLLPTVQPGVRFTQAPDSARLRKGIRARDTTGTPRPFSLTTTDGTTYRLQFDPPLAPDQFVDVTVSGAVFADADTTYQWRFRRVTSRVLGGLAGRVRVADTTREAGRVPGDTTALRIPPEIGERREADTLVVPLQGGTEEDRSARLDSAYYGGPVRVELLPVESTLPVAPRRVTTPAGSTFTFRELPEGQFRVRAYLDRNENGRWDVGQIQPYVPAEPVTWVREPVESRPRWTTELPAPIRIPVLPPVPRGQNRTSSDSARVPSGGNR
ncbi:MAG: Ig-like domain-containing protein [Salinibacter sp.]